jgi:hypothetical protein
VPPDEWQLSEHVGADALDLTRTKQAKRTIKITEESRS